MGVAVEIFFLIGATFALFRRAKQRGVNPTPFAIGALLAWFLLLWVHPIWPSAYLVALRWAPVAALFMAVELARPSRLYAPWECPDCHTLNTAASLTCVCRRLRPDLRT
jgi:hypothetical protein